MKYCDVEVGMRVSPKCVDWDDDIPIGIIVDAKSDGTFLGTNKRWYELGDYYALDKEPFKEGDVVVCTRNHNLNLVGLTLVVKSINHGCFRNKENMLDGTFENFYDADYFVRVEYK